MRKMEAKGSGEANLRHINFVLMSTLWLSLTQRYGHKADGIQAALYRCMIFYFVLNK